MSNRREELMQQLQSTNRLLNDVAEQLAGLNEHMAKGVTIGADTTIVWKMSQSILKNHAEALKLLHDAYTSITDSLDKCDEEDGLRS